MNGGPEAEGRAAEDAPADGGRKPFLLRLSPELHGELKRWAAAELRSLNGQIEFLLRAAVRQRRSGGSPEDSTGNPAPPGD